MPQFDAPGNIKDPEKIAAAIKAKEAQWIERAALSALTGQVLCVGLLTESFGHLEGNEKTLLESFWTFARTEIRAGNLLVGFCVKMFDLPFLIRRSWAHGVAVPGCIWHGRYTTEAIVDLAEKWECGVRGGDHISLDQLSKFLGIGQKNGDGKDFAALWATDKAKALEYLENDLRLVQRAHERMCGL